MTEMNKKASESNVIYDDEDGLKALTVVLSKIGNAFVVDHGGIAKAHLNHGSHSFR